MGPGAGITLDIPSIIAILALLFGGGSLTAVLVQIWGKRVKTPGDRQAEIEFGTKVLQDALTDSRADKAANEETIRTLRAYITQLESESRQDRDRERADNDLILKLKANIATLERLVARREARIAQLEERQANVAGKITRGEVITIRDILGDTGPIPVQLHPATEPFVENMLEA